jgi:hypothetical protein
MATKSEIDACRPRWRKGVWGTALLVLLLPGGAMQFTDHVEWDRADFIVFGLMLLVACGSYELAARWFGSSAYRTGVAIALGTALLLVWANLSVGIVGSEDNPVNRAYYGVLLVGVAGASIARFRAAGMARALVATAAAQTFVGVILLVAGYGIAAALTVFFDAFWLLSAWLFLKAARGGADI